MIINCFKNKMKSHG